MRVGVGTSTASHKSLGLWPEILEFVAQWDGATFAIVRWLVSEDLHRSLSDDLVNLRAEITTSPAIAGSRGLISDLSTIRRVGLEDALQCLAQSNSINTRWNSKGQLQVCVRPHDIGSTGNRRNAVAPGNSKSWLPCLVDQKLSIVICDQLAAFEWRHNLVGALAKVSSDILSLLDAVRWDVDVRLLDLDLTGLLVFQPGDEHTGNSEGGRDKSGCHTAVAWCSEVVDRKSAVDNTSERCAAPDCVVVLSFAVEDNDQADFTNVWPKLIEVALDFGVATLLTTFEEHCDLRVLEVVLVQVLDGRHEAEGVVAVVVCATAVNFVALDNWVGCRKALAPAGGVKMWHLVKVAVGENGFCGRGSSRNLDHEKRLAAWVGEDGRLQAWDALGFDPLFDCVDGLVNKTVREEFSVRGRSKIRNADE